MARSNKTPALIASSSDLILDGTKVDGRSAMARHFRDTFNDLAIQIGDGNIAPSETAMLRRAATLSVLCERDETAIIAGEKVDEENYRRNAQALRATLISLGLAKKSRDVTKSDGRFFDQHTQAILDAD